MCKVLAEKGCEKVKKIKIIFWLLVFIIQPLPTSAIVFINQECVGINHININCRNYSNPVIYRQIIGNSYQNRPIEAVYLTPPSHNQTILATFAIHGFEDQYYGDGIILTHIAEQVIKYYSEQPELLKSTRLIIIPCVNPDGINASLSNNGFGRCNAQGIDINRDFDYNWDKIYTRCNKTGDTPFTTPEAQVLRDIVLKENPDIILDFHGWLDCCYSSDSELKSFFVNSLNLGEEKQALQGYKPMQGYFIGWASEYARAALIEYEYNDAYTLSTQTIQAFNCLIQNTY
jgi:hypothetical protein